MKAVFIATHQRGFEADPVIDILRKRGVPIFRFNTDAGQSPSSTTYTTHGRPEIRFACDGREIEGISIGVGWCQQLPPNTEESASSWDRTQRENLNAAFFAACELLDISWLNKPEDLIRASNKILQLELAKTVGLRIPLTLVSNNPSRIRDFVKVRPTVAKNLATPWIGNNSNLRAAYTKLVSPDWLANDASLEFSPVIYQEYIMRARDYRVVVIGDSVFATYCKPTRYQFEDVRRGVATGDSYQSCEFDAGATRQLKALMSKLSIQYCSADFMEDKDGNLYFLEANSCGAWWWVDRLYGGNICRTIADYLFLRNAP